MRWKPSASAAWRARLYSLSTEAESTFAQRRPGRWVRRLAVVTTLGMFVVLVMGATVTNTGSAEGCGRSWPLCNGQFIPELTVATAIEYSHRAVTGVEGVLVVALTVVMVGTWRREREVLALAVVMLGTLLLQAGLGAGAVLMPQSPLMLATHFGVSLVAFAATFLSAAVVFERSRAVPAVWHSAPRRFRWSIYAVAVYVLAVVYLGAYVRHAGVSLACADWPLCNGQVVPALEGPTAVVFAHRLAALGALLLLAWLVRLSSVTGIGQRAAWASFGLAIVQALSGAVVVWTRLGLFSTLAHAAIMAALFAALALLARQVLSINTSAEHLAEEHHLADDAADQAPPPTGQVRPRQHALATSQPGITPARERGGPGANHDRSPGQWPRGHR